MTEKEIADYKKSSDLDTATSNAEKALVAIALELHRIANALETKDKWADGKHRCAFSELKFRYGLDY